MSRLKNIEQTAKHVANAMSAALKFDIEIVDENLEIIVISDGVEIAPQQYYYDSGIVKRVLFQEDAPRTVMVTKPGEDPLCKGCERYGLCTYKSAIYSILKSDGKIIGAISIATRKDDIRNQLIKEADEMQRFIEIMSDLISAKAREFDSYVKLQADAELLDTVINNIDKGVITLSNSLEIIDINDTLTKRLDVKKDNYYGQHVSALFPILKGSDASVLETKELDLELGNEKLFFMSSFNPLYSKDGQSGYAMILDDLNDVSHMSYAMLQRQDEIVLSNIIGEDQSVISLKEKIKAIADLDSTVLLCGETGTGKELFSRALHFESERCNGPFVSINCGAIPESLIESELFGYDKGTFTGGNKMGKHGKFFLANKGTILLDEVENMPLHLQQKLLRVIERKKIERIGSVESIPIDVRIIAATNIPLEVLVERKQFREDLYHRLNVFTLRIPSLRDRKSDIFLLTEYFISLFNKKFKKTIQGLSPTVRDIFKYYDWKGNVRELQNTIEYAVHMESGEIICKESLPYQFHQADVKESRFLTLEEMEEKHIKEALDHYGWTEDGRIRAAEKLGISRSTIYRKIKKITERN